MTYSHECLLMRAETDLISEHVSRKYVIGVISIIFLKLLLWMVITVGISHKMDIYSR